MLPGCVSPAVVRGVKWHGLFVRGANMLKTFSAVLLVAIAGCSGLHPYDRTVSPCAAGEATYACQIQRYHDVAAE
jgi:hypothetical protein